MSIMHVLAIETSCDETAISIIRKDNGVLTLLSNQISSQVKLHAAWGGVVPNLAAREHLKNITPLFQTSLREAAISKNNIDLIAVTNGPGLIPALMVGTNFAKTLSFLWEKPLLGIHHIEGHIYANFIGDKIGTISNDQFPMTKQIPTAKSQTIKAKNGSSTKFPILCLVVSGGHTQLILMRNHFQYEIIGQTLDDAVGEAFDKVARILNIGYPGGPAVAQRATQVKSEKLKVKNDSKYKILDTQYEIRLPRPMLHKNNFDFSFSGLKTAVLYETKKNPKLLKDEQYIAAVCHEFQQACVDVLVTKTIKAAAQHEVKTIMLAGGVSANKELREQLGNAVKKNLPTAEYKLPALEFTGDNAAMIAAAAALRFEKMTQAQKKQLLKNWKTLPTSANLKLN